MLNDFIEKIKQHFEEFKVIKPKASRAKSSEIFILGLQKLKNSKAKFFLAYINPRR
jgi:23S rRNA U2552 (ribose-2'-O)-methylase RlmE/FtsJ